MAVSSALVTISLIKRFDRKRTRYRLSGMSPPYNKKTNEVISWIGRFLPPFYSKLLSIASPLTYLTKRDRRNSIRDWQDQPEKAFQTLKNRLTSSPILRLPVFQNGTPFVLRTNASDVGIGAVLPQEIEGEGRLPIAYASKKLLPRERTTP